MSLDYFEIDYPQDIIFDKFKGTSEEKFFVYVSENLFQFVQFFQRVLQLDKIAAVNFAENPAHQQVEQSG